MVLVALTLMAIVITLGFLLDVSLVLIKKQQLQSAAELGVSAGGGFVVQAIVDQGKTPAEVQDAAFANQVIDLTKKYIKLNLDTHESWSKLSIDNIAEITYPKERNDCTNATSTDVLVEANLTVPHTFLFGGLLKTLGGKESIDLKSNAKYRITICP